MDVIFVFLAGFCQVNVTCNCERSVKESRRIIEDRNFALFNRGFENAIIQRIFVKPGDKDYDKDKKDDEDDDDKKKIKKLDDFPFREKKLPPLYKRKSDDSDSSDSVKVRARN